MASTDTGPQDGRGFPVSAGVLLGYQVLGVRAQTLAAPATTRTQPVPRGWRTPMALPVDNHCSGC